MPNRQVGAPVGSPSSLPTVGFISVVFGLGFLHLCSVRGMVEVLQMLGVALLCNWDNMWLTVRSLRSMFLPRISCNPLTRWIVASWMWGLDRLAHPGRFPCLSFQYDANVRLRFVLAADLGEPWTGEERGGRRGEGEGEGREERSGEGVSPKFVRTS